MRGYQDRNIYFFSNTIERIRISSLFKYLFRSLLSARGLRHLELRHGMKKSCWLVYQGCKGISTNEPLNNVVSEEALISFIAKFPDNLLFEFEEMITVPVAPANS